MANRCKAINKFGEPCGGYALTGSEYCYIHDPARAADRAKTRKLGGHNRRTAHGGDSSTLPKTVRTMMDVYQVLDYTLAETIALDNSIIRTRALIALSEAYIHALEVGELEARILKLEEVQNVKH